MSYDKLNTYGQNQKATAVPTGNSRDTDSRALAACARRLDDARKLLESDMKSRENLKSTVKPFARTSVCGPSFRWL